jgi:hypothetical protein
LFDKERTYANSKIDFSPTLFCFFPLCLYFFSSASALHSSANNHALSKFMMPAMSPTMTEGGIAAWKKKAGDTFAAGDVLLEIVSNKVSCF